MSAQLTFVGVGFGPGQITLEGLAALRRATKVYYYGECSGLPWLKRLFPDAVDLFTVTEGNSAERMHRYENCVEFLLAQVRQGHTVAVAFYGSAALVVCISHNAVRRAHEQGISARIIPGVSCFEALLCDLAGHPTAARAIQRAITLLTASEYLSAAAKFSREVSLVITCSCIIDHPGDGENVAGLLRLADALARSYGRYHEIVAYSALPEGPFIRSWPIFRFPEIRIPPEGWTQVTLFVPPADPHPGAQARAIQRAFDLGYAKAAAIVTENRKLIK